MASIYEEEVTFEEIEPVTVINMRILNDALANIFRKKQPFPDYGTRLKKTIDDSQAELVYDGEDILYPYLQTLYSAYKKLEDVIDIDQTAINKYAKKVSIERLEKGRVEAEKLIQKWYTTIGENNYLIENKSDYYDTSDSGNGLEAQNRRLRDQIDRANDDIQKINEKEAEINSH